MATSKGLTGQVRNSPGSSPPDSDASVETVYSQPAPASDRRVKGEWSARFNLANVAIHAHLLPTGEVLYWGRREYPCATTFASLNEHKCFPFLLDLATMQSRPTPQPKRADGELINLFCSSHTFLPDGRLFVTGGHCYDSQGIEQSTIYDPFTDTWSAGPVMEHGRWYPTAITLGDGSVLVCSGQYASPGPVSPPPPPPLPQTPTNNTPEIWIDGHQGWTQLTDFRVATKEDLTLFPRLHLAPDGRLFMSGTSAASYFFDTADNGTWTRASSRQAGVCEYAPSVMYDTGKVIYIGGGSPPNNTVEVIDLNTATPAWRTVQSMHFARRQHNATLLPDGTILVTGGTKGEGFNDLSVGQPVRTAELWNPTTEAWTLLADEDVDRCYHSTAVLLPDGNVLSAGGGEFNPGPGWVSNDPAATHTDAQIFKPPYQFKGPRPDILYVQETIEYGQPFDVATSNPGEIKRASLVRLTSVTHSFNQNQRINFLTPTDVKDGTVTFAAPAHANLCPPGHYLLFLLNQEIVPSIAKIIRVKGHPTAAPRVAAEKADPVVDDAAIVANAKRPPVAIGLVSTCPYGCWGNALTILAHLKDVEIVRPIVNTQDSVAYVYLNHDGLPDTQHWQEEFARVGFDAYEFRGVEVTLQGAIEWLNGELTMLANEHRPAVRLSRLEGPELVQRRRDSSGATQPPNGAELRAFDRLVELLRELSGNVDVEVTGPLQKDQSGFVLKVRSYEQTT